MSASAHIRDTLRHTDRVLSQRKNWTPQGILRRAKRVEESLGKGRIHEAIAIVQNEECARLRRSLDELYLNADDAHLLADAEALERRRAESGNG